jgi:hypothetical protein
VPDGFAIAPATFALFPAESASSLCAAAPTLWGEPLPPGGVDSTSRLPKAPLSLSIIGGLEIFFPKNPEGTARVLFSAVLHRIPQSMVVVY